MSDVFSKWRKDAAEVPWVEVDSEDLTAMLDVIEAADEYATWGEKENRKILLDVLARVRDLIGDDDE